MRRIRPASGAPAACPRIAMIVVDGTAHPENPIREMSSCRKRASALRATGMREAAWHGL
jgi:hypothetical protein